jgi:hypothetical protein
MTDVCRFDFNVARIAICIRNGAATLGQFW